jgi:hypothetical protein
MTQARWKATVIGVLVTLAGATAYAQGDPTAFGGKGHAALSAERLFGFVRADTTTTAGGVDRTSHINALSLLGSSLGLFTVYAQPRVALDFFATDGLTVGASLSYFRVSQSTDLMAGQVASSPTISGYVLAPRLGYAVALGRIASLWPRLGFTYAHLGSETSTTFNGMTMTSTNGTGVYALTIEAPFVFVVAPHFFLSAAPTVDIGLGGSTSNSAPGGVTTSTDSKETDYGLLLGLGGFL